MVAAPRKIIPPAQTYNPLTGTFTQGTTAQVAAAAVATSQAAVNAVNATPVVPAATPQPSGGPSSSGPSPATPAYIAPPPPPAPLLPVFVPMKNVNSNIKVAPSDIIQFDDSAVEIALITDLLYEDVGATELANISRYDLIDGLPVNYSPIKNLATVRREYNPNNIVSTARDSDYFSRFAIDGSVRGMKAPYFDSNGDLVIEVDIVLDSEEIEVQVLANGTISVVDEL